MGDSTTPGLPTSWRDVHTLVRDSSERIEGKLDSLTAAFSTHLLEHAAAAGEARGREAGQNRIIGLGRSTVALIVSILAGAASLASLAAMIAR